MDNSLCNGTFKLLDAVTAGAEALCRATGWPDNIDRFLRTIGQATGVSRVWIFQTVELGEDYIVQDYVAEWADISNHVQIGMPMFSMKRTEINEPEYRKLIEDRKKGKWHKILPRHLPDSWLRRTLLDQQGILSMLTVPVMVDGVWWGVLGLDDCRREYDWTDRDVQAMRLAAIMLANSILRSHLHATTKQFEILQGITASSTWEYDVHRSRLWLSGHFVKRGELSGSNLFMSPRSMMRLIQPTDRADFFSALRSYIQEDFGGTFRHDVRLRRPDERGWVWSEVIGRLKRDEDGNPLRMAGIVVDIGHRKTMETRLREQARTDPLTGASNRRTFEQHLSFYMSRAVTEEMELSLLMIDFDRFKRINDTWGHGVGDMVLKKFVEIANECLRGGDVLYRLGGEEFAVILPGAGARAAARVGERIRESIEDLNLLLESGVISFTISIGCATRKNDQTRPDSLMEAADESLMHAKRSGRNRLVCFGELEG